ncbi:hypothetical protein CCMSSC00406_0009726 [Pleurotus cornucopiae]|uniref:Uncharacterized protein n=1 Tax=Pleurotus cornucopiae TaxID=5321 RepID=A0ACB7J8A9_PLECO|nr:hypothetical protein CCMSSC00406_0009726 [Pleurotus cornucopiae]
MFTLQQKVHLAMEQISALLSEDTMPLLAFPLDASNDGQSCVGVDEANVHLIGGKNTIKARHHGIMGSLRSKATLADLIDQIVHIADPGTQGKLRIKGEDRAICRLISGYAGYGDLKESKKGWYPYHRSRASWLDLSKFSHAVTTKEGGWSLSDMILGLDMHLLQDTPTEATSRYVSFVLRTIDNIKFAYMWCLKESAPGAARWRQEYYSEAFSHTMEGQQMGSRLAALESLYKDLEAAVMQLFPDGTIRKTLTDVAGQIVSLQATMDTARQEFTRAHARVITEQKIVGWLYDEFGCALLLDPFWDITGNGKYQAANQSMSFINVVNVVLNTLEKEKHPLLEKRIPNIAHFERTNQEVLFMTLSSIAEQPVADFVNSFVENTPTLMRGYLGSQ